MIITKRVIVTLPLLIFLLFICAPSDNAFWEVFTARVDLSKKIRFDLEEQVRINNDYSNVNNLISEAALSYELTKQIKAKSSFRYYYNPGSFNRFRYTVDLAYEYSKKGFPLNLQYRGRFQHTVEQYTRDFSNYIRNKFSAEYKLSKLVDPYFAYESYFRLNYVNRFTVNRYYAGLTWRVSNNIDFETFFLYESEFGERNPNSSKIIGLNLIVDLEF
ncbi:MAG: DUF2490 domain-containing protein [Bacteroidales bacterium]|nr:DUF2490 domain-containing protein [Bacteroidales bacterium]